MSTQASVKERGQTRARLFAAVMMFCFVGFVGPVAAQGPATGEQPEAGPAGEQPAGDEAEAPAPPAPRPRVLMLSVDSVEGKLTKLVPERVDTTTRKRLGDDGRVDVMKTFEEIQEELAKQGVSSAVVYEAAQIYSSGIGLLTAGQNEAALDSFKRAVELLEANLADVQDYNVLSDAVMNLALAYHLNGFDLDGRKRMKQFADMKPDFVLNKDKFPQELREVFDEEVAKIKKAGPGKLVVTSNVEGAKVWVDGVEKGVTPLVLEDVGFGYHYMVVRDDAGNTWAEQIRVRGRGKEQAISAELSAAGEKQQEAGELPGYYTDLVSKIQTGAYTVADLEPYLVELSTKTRAPHIAWITMYKDNFQYVAVPFIWRESDGRLVQVKETRFNFELSDLAIGVSKMSRNIADAMEAMPEDQAVTSVKIGPKPVVVATTPIGPANGDGGTNGNTGDTKSPVVIVTPDPGDKDKDKTKPLVPPPGDEKPSKANRKWKVVGASAAAVVIVGGLVAGTVVLLSDSGEEPEPGATGFSAEVSW